jgi:predicted RNA-binding Zn-ribbon protein involved in translation (DUF1610 family)
MHLELLCPACGIRELDFDDHETLVLLAPNLALAQFSCPGCGIHLSVTVKLTPDMRHRVQQRLNAEAEAATASEGVGADGEGGPGEASGPQAPATPGTEGASSTPGTLSTPNAPGAQGTPVASHRLVPDPSLLSYASNLVVGQYDPGIDFMRSLRAGVIDMKAHVEYFKRQLEGIETVDEAIAEIDTGYYREKRDV